MFERCNILEQQNGASVEIDKIFIEKLTILVYNILPFLAIFLYGSAFRIYKHINKYSIYVHTHIYIHKYRVFIYELMYYAGNIFMTNMILVPFV